MPLWSLIHLWTTGFPVYFIPSASVRFCQPVTQITSHQASYDSVSMRFAILFRTRKFSWQKSSCDLSPLWTRCYYAYTCWNKGDCTSRKQKLPILKCVLCLNEDCSAHLICQPLREIMIDVYFLFYLLISIDPTVNCLGREGWNIHDSKGPFQAVYEFDRSRRDCSRRYLLACV